MRRWTNKTFPCLCSIHFSPDAFEAFSRPQLEKTKTWVFRKFYSSTAIFSLFSFLLITRKAVKTYIVSLVALRMKITAKSRTMCHHTCILFCELCILSCVAVKIATGSASSSLSATISHHQNNGAPTVQNMYKTMWIFHGFSTTYFSKRHHLRYIKPYKS